MTSSASAVEEALQLRSDLEMYGHNKRLLFALQLDHEIEDIHSIAEDSLTDGSDDKALDLVYVDREAGEVIIGQGYEAQSPARQTRPVAANKAAELHQAVSWLLTAPEDSLPPGLREAARDVRSAFSAKEIKRVRLWLVHNCVEGGNATNELAQAAQGTQALLHSRFGITSDDVSVSSLEIGPDLLGKWYEGAQTPILVRDRFQLSLPKGYLEADGDNWRAVCASVSADWLHSLYREHGSAIFSANVRGYLGSARSEKNINHGIKQSATDSPEKFWAFNNGVTAVVNDWRTTRDRNGVILELSGIAIVNGAQTTGALGTVEASPKAEVLARFIRCGDLATVRDIIRFNNRQNPTQAADFRSNDRVQRRLREEFDGLGVVDYSGGRRGGASDVIKRPADNMISASVAAQALAAFHGSPGIAYHEKGKIWEDDRTYGQLFNDQTVARHILFVVSALKCVEKEKTRLRGIAEAELDQASATRLNFLRRRGSQFLLLAALGSCSELLVGHTVPDRNALVFAQNLSVPEAVDVWKPVIVDAVMPLAANALDPALRSERGLRSEEVVRDHIETLRSLLESVAPSHDATLTTFRSSMQPQAAHA